VAWRDAAHALLKMAWWLWTAWFLVGFLRAFVIVERRPREGKLLQDLLAGLIYLTALFAIVSYVFDLPVQGLLATSGVIAIILGLEDQGLSLARLRFKLSSRTPSARRAGGPGLDDNRHDWRARESARRHSDPIDRRDQSPALDARRRLSGPDRA